MVFSLCEPDTVDEEPAANQTQMPSGSFIYQWRIADGYETDKLPYQVVAQHSFASAKIYQVSVTRFNATGAEVDSFATSVLIETSPSCPSGGITDPLAVMVNDPVVFTICALPLPTGVITWDFGDGSPTEQ